MIVYIIRSSFLNKKTKMFTQMFPQQISSQMATKMVVFVSVQECYVAMNPQKEEQAANKTGKTGQQKRGTFPQQQWNASAVLCLIIEVLNNTQVKNRIWECLAYIFSITWEVYCPCTSHHQDDPTFWVSLGSPIPTASILTMLLQFLTTGWYPRDQC